MSGDGTNQGRDVSQIVQVRFIGGPASGMEHEFFRDVLHERITVPVAPSDMVAYHPGAPPAANEGWGQAAYRLTVREFLTRRGVERRYFYEHMG